MELYTEGGTRGGYRGRGRGFRGGFRGGRGGWRGAPFRGYNGGAPARGGAFRGSYERGSSGGYNGGRGGSYTRGGYNGGGFRGRGRGNGYRRNRKFNGPPPADIELSRTRIYIRNLPFNLNAQDLEASLKKKGYNVKEVSLAMRRFNPNLNIGYGFVEFISEDEQ